MISADNSMSIERKTILTTSPPMFFSCFIANKGEDMCIKATRVCPEKHEHRCNQIIITLYSSFVHFTHKLNFTFDTFFWVQAVGGRTWGLSRRVLRFTLQLQYICNVLYCNAFLLLMNLSVQFWAVKCEENMKHTQRRWRQPIQNDNDERIRRIKTTNPHI